MRFIRLAICAAFSFLMLSVPVEAATVQDVVDLVSQTEYANFHGNSLFTHLGDNRGLDEYFQRSAQHVQAQANIYNEFQSDGLNPVEESFLGGSGCNVVATLPGTVHPEQIYLVGAHYDSSNTPGADDNASSVAAMVEAARVLSQFEFEYTIKFVAFDLEEWGCWGSTAYVNAHRYNDLVGLRGMINMDMVAFNHPSPEHHDRAWVYCAEENPSSLAIRQIFADAVTRYGGIAVDLGVCGLSDHNLFAEWGSAMLCEHAMDLHGIDNPYFDYPEDAVESTFLYEGQTYDYINYAYATNMTRGVVGYLATQAVLVPEPSTILILLIGLVGLSIHGYQALRRSGR